MKTILTDIQLKKKLTDYNVIFTDDEFIELKRRGFYHVFNSFMEKSVRTNGNQKLLSEYLALYKMDIELRSVIFPMLLEVEGLLKQRLNDVITQTILNNSETSPDHTAVLKYCVSSVSGSGPKKKLKAMQILFKSCQHNGTITSHFFVNDENLPIWAYLELLDLGDFLSFFEIMTSSCGVVNSGEQVKELFARNCNFVNVSGTMLSYNTDGKVIFQMLTVFKRLRNHVAHNQPVIDMRFKKSEYGARNLSDFIYDLEVNLATKLQGTMPDITIAYDFDSITDVLTLLFNVYVTLESSEDNYSNRLKDFIKSNIYTLPNSLNATLHSKVFGSNYRKKCDFINRL